MVMRGKVGRGSERTQARWRVCKRIYTCEFVLIYVIKSVAAVVMKGNERTLSHFYEVVFVFCIFVCTKLQEFFVCLFSLSIFTV